MSYSGSDEHETFGQDGRSDSAKKGSDSINDFTKKSSDSPSNSIQSGYPSRYPYAHDQTAPFNVEALNNVLSSMGLPPYSPYDTESHANTRSHTPSESDSDSDSDDSDTDADPETSIATIRLTKSIISQASSAIKSLEAEESVLRQQEAEAKRVFHELRDRRRAKGEEIREACERKKRAQRKLKRVVKGAVLYSEKKSNQKVGDARKEVDAGDAKADRVKADNVKTDKIKTDNKTTSAQKEDETRDVQPDKVQASNEDIPTPGPSIFNGSTLKTVLNILVPVVNTVIKNLNEPEPLKKPSSTGTTGHESPKAFEAHPIDSDDEMIDFTGTELDLDDDPVKK